MLGSPWIDEEVERFYKAYRKYGKDWKKVAAMVRTRNSEMVEALYTMNRAYLSLPEGTASVVGFIAMVSDHYNALEGSDNEKEINDLPKLLHKPKKRTHKLLQQNGGPEDQLQSRLVGSSDRSLPQLKRRESDGSGGAENVGGEEFYQKRSKFYGQKDDNEFDDGGEACSGTGEGLAVGVEAADENIEQSSSQGKRKRNKKLFFRDETSGLDALQTLADLSLLIQSGKHIMLISFCSSRLSPMYA
ncbi:hypothetical protein M8C21_005348, partial [Ambrosia artemisiifolia]